MAAELLDHEESWASTAVGLDEMTTGSVAGDMADTAADTSVTTGAETVAAAFAEFPAERPAALPAEFPAELPAVLPVETPLALTAALSVATDGESAETPVGPANMAPLNMASRLGGSGSSGSASGSGATIDDRERLFLSESFGFDSPADNPLEAPFGAGFRLVEGVVMSEELVSAGDDAES